MFITEKDYFYQWDSNVEISVEREDITQIHFCNRTDDCSLVVELEDKKCYFPNILFTQSMPIYVYAYDGNQTRYEKRFDVRPRTKPSDYIYTETEIVNVESLRNDMVGKKVNGGEIFNSDENEITGDYGHSEGVNTKAGWRSHSEGYLTEAKSTSHSEGRLSKATGKCSHSEGMETYNLCSYVYQGVNCHSYELDIEGVGGECPVKEGDYIAVFPYYNGQPTTDVREVVEIVGDDWGQTWIPDENDEEQGGTWGDIQYYTVRLNKPFYDEDNYPYDYIDDDNFNKSEVKIATGCRATGEGSHSEGKGTLASGSSAHSEGYSTKATGSYSHSEGYMTEASGSCSHAQGSQTKAKHEASFTSGLQLESGRNYQTVLGRWNQVDSDALFIVATGNKSAPKNSLVVDNSGRTKVNYLVLTSPNGTNYRVQVSNTGALTATKI